MSTTPNQPQPQEPEPESGPTPEQPGDEATEARDALRNLGDKPRPDEVGETAYSAVPPPLPPIGDPAQGPVQDSAPGASAQPQTGFTAPGGEQPQQSPYQQQSPHQPQTPYQQTQQPQGSGQYAGAQQGSAQEPYSGDRQYTGTQGAGQGAYGGGPQAQSQYGASGSFSGQYQAAPPPPPYGQPFGYPASDLPPGMPPLADWGQRATAFILDNGVAIVAGWVAGGARNDSVDIVFGIIGFFGVIWSIVQAVRAGRTGQSYGKRVMGIRLARLVDGQPVGGGLAFLRLFLDWLFWVLCIIPGVLNLLWPLWDRKNQTWCDKIAKSVVVKAR